MDEKKLETELTKGLKELDKFRDNGELPAPEPLPRSVKALDDALKANRAAEQNPVPPTTTSPQEITPAHPAHPYHHLMHILKLAYQQSAEGKGKSRHASSPVGNRPWLDQPILTNARQLGPAAPAFQVMKKTQEAVAMAGNLNYDAAMAEMLGAIVYAAATYQLLWEMKAANQPK